MSIEESSVPEYQPPQESRDSSSGADELFEILARQMNDPYIERFHGLARAFAGHINDDPTYSSAIIDRAIATLDGGWQYTDTLLTVTAPLWVQGDDGTFIACVQLTNQPVVSRGFMYQKKVLGADMTGTDGAPFYPGHYVRVNPQEGLPQAIRGVVFLDDIQHLSLPYPSDDMREVTFQYYYPELASQIDELIEHSPRPDQTLLRIGNIEVPLDETDSTDAETLRDLAAYLEKRVALDKDATYRMSIAYEYGVVKDDSTIVPVDALHDLRKIAKVHSICLLPTLDGIVEGVPGIKQYIPYLHITTLEADGPTTDQRLLIPCRALRWIGSSRYDIELGPNYPQGETSDA